MSTHTLADAVPTPWLTLYPHTRRCGKHTLPDVAPTHSLTQHPHTHWRGTHTLTDAVPTHSLTPYPHSLMRYTYTHWRSTHTHSLTDAAHTHTHWLSTPTHSHTLTQYILLSVYLKQPDANFSPEGLQASVLDRAGGSSRDTGGAGVAAEFLLRQSTSRSLRGPSGVSRSTSRSDRSWVGGGGTAATGLRRQLLLAAKRSCSNLFSSILFSSTSCSRLRACSAWRSSTSFCFLQCYQRQPV
jgi:hypothetical protein